MGWQSRLKDKPKFEKTCNKCNGLGYKRKYISINGISDAVQTVQCKCKAEPEIISVRVPTI